MTVGSDRRALRLVVADAELARVLDLADGRPVSDEDLPSLAAGGWITDGVAADAFAEGLAALADPVCELALLRGDRRGRAAANARFAIVIVPGPGGHQLIVLPTDFLPDALARLNDLGPRPRAAGGPVLRYAVEEFERIVAARDDPFAALRERWRVELQWTDAVEDRRALEVLDTDAGLWLVVSEDAVVDLRPISPTAVFRRLIELVAGPPAAAGSSEGRRVRNGR